MVDDSANMEPSATSHRSALVSDLFALLQRDAAAQKGDPVSHIDVTPAGNRSLMKMDVPVEIHAPPSVAGRSHYSPPAASFTPRPSKQLDFDVISEAPLPTQTRPQMTQPSEEDPIEILNSHDPQVLQQQQLLWEDGSFNPGRLHSSSSPRTVPGVSIPSEVPGSFKFDQETFRPIRIQVLAG